MKINNLGKLEYNKRKKIMISLIAMLVMITVLFRFNLVFAVTQSEINSAKNEQTNVNNQINETKEKVEEVQEEKNETLKQVERLNTQIGEYETQIDSLTSQIEEATQKIAEKETQIEAAQKQYDETLSILEKRLVAMYESGKTTFLDLLFNSTSLTDFISNYYLLSEITEMDQELLEKIQGQKAELEKAKSDLESEKTKLNESKEKVESVSKQLKVVQSEKEAYAQNLSQEEKELQAQIDELKAYENTISSKIKQMKAKYDAEQAAAAAAKAKANTSSNNSSTNTSNATSSFGFGWPVANPSIGTRYGVSGRYWSLGYHTGIDFRASTGTSVYAVGDGMVFDTGYNSSYGRYVEIYHGNNVYSFYAHGSSVNVSTGQTVSKGQQIMLSGATGNVTGPHLHFEIRTPSYKFSSCVNPASYLP